MEEAVKRPLPRSIDRWKQALSMNNLIRMIHMSLAEENN